MKVKSKLEIFKEALAALCEEYEYRLACLDFNVEVHRNPSGNLGWIEDIEDHT